MLPDQTKNFIKNVNRIGARTEPIKMVENVAVKIWGGTVYIPKWQAEEHREAIEKLGGKFINL